MKKRYTGYWYRCTQTHTIMARNGEDAWQQLIKWADEHHIQFPTNFLMRKER